jgi:hypothetical protein
MMSTLLHGSLAVAAFMVSSKPPKLPGVPGVPDIDAVKDAAADFVSEFKGGWDALAETGGKVFGDAQRDKSDPLHAIIFLEGIMGPHRPTIASDLTVSGGVLSMSVHQGLAPYPTYELHMTATNPADGWMGKRKMSAMGARRTLHMRRPIVLQGHDIRVLPHAVVAATFPEGLALSAKCTFLASRKCVFGAAKITIDSTAPLGSCTLINWPPTPMVFCADPLSLPLGDAPTSHFNTVRFHMSMLDYLMAWAEIGVDMIFDALLHEITSGKGKTGAEEQAAKDWKDPFAESLNPFGKVIEDNAKNAATTAVQLAILYGADTSDHSREPERREVGWSFGATIYGTDVVSVSGSFSKSKDGEWGHSSLEAGGKLVEPGKEIADGLKDWGPVL